MDSGIGPALAKLPERCVSREPTSGRLVVVQRGRQGFQYINGERSPEAYNRALGLSYEQVEAMEYGALFGFDAELADPDRVRKVREELGQPVGPISAAPVIPASRPAPPPTTRADLPEDIGNFAPWFQEALAHGRKR
ncbi:hypothetical protein [Nevskia soli]|uniref:hypothetical protein n=1 Tax=Nevskia soli TaxID=418856 RepID=UPI0004A70773|nr:hypothetical protein [Nevskia soli]